MSIEPERERHAHLRPEDVQLGERIAVGGGGEVYGGVLKGRIPVIVKLFPLKSDVQERRGGGFFDTLITTAEIWMGGSNEERILQHLNKHNVGPIFHDSLGIKVEGKIRFGNVMERIEGRTLAKVQSEQRLDHKILPLNISLGYVENCLSELAVAHRLGIIHRDIDPTNIIIGDDDKKAHVIDWGIARYQGEDIFVYPTRNTIGKPFSVPPEQMRPSSVKRHERIGPYSDVYSMGIVLWELVTGVDHHSYGSLQSNWYAHVTSGQHQEYLQMELLARKAPKALQEIILCATDPNIGNRYHNAGEMLEAIQAVELPKRSFWPFRRR